MRAVCSAAPDTDGPDGLALDHPCWDSAFGWHANGCYRDEGVKCLLRKVNCFPVIGLQVESEARFNYFAKGHEEIEMGLHANGPEMLGEKDEVNDVIQDCHAIIALEVTLFCVFLITLTI